MLKLTIKIINEEGPRMTYKLHRELVDGEVIRLSLGIAE